MGNLRDKYTNEEWDKMESEIETDRKNGKPDEILLQLSIWKKMKQNIVGFNGYLLCKIVYVEHKDTDTEFEGYTMRGFVMQKRLGSMLLITPIMLIIYFVIYGIGGFLKWFNFIISYKCHYISTSKKQLTFKEKLRYTYYFISNY